MSEQLEPEYMGYFIPVEPLYQLWQQPREVATAELLTAVYAYLFAEAGVSYYRDEENPMHYNYDVLSEWIDEGDEYESGSYEQQRIDHELAMCAGDFVREKMTAIDFRESLPQLIGAFVPETDMQREALRIACKTLALWQQYPGKNLFAHASDTTTDDDYGYDSAIYMHEYISFVSSTTGALGEMLIEMVENDFNERSRQQLPEQLTHFTEVQAPYTDILAYERAVFSLIDDLCTLL